MKRIGGIAANELASTFGTPALFLDLDAFDSTLDRMLEAAARRKIGVSYAAKALLLVKLAEHLKPRPIGIDVSSLGELLTAERGGIAATRITMHGAGKTRDEIEAAFAGRAHRLVIDSLDELRRIDGASRGRRLDVLLRVNTGIEAHTHEFIRTAGDDSKFGLAPRDFDEALHQLRTRPHLNLRGVHSHIGSQIYDAAPFAANAQHLSEIVVRIRATGFGNADTLVVGGGFGVQMNPGEAREVLDFEAALDAIAAEVPNGMSAEIEPGRSLIAPCGTTLYSVVAIKRYNRRTFAIVDGSMADNPRPALYGAYHHITALRQSDAALHEVTVAGRSCENDELGIAQLPADLRSGDLLAVDATGAYTYSMASNYNRFPRPPVIGVTKGAAITFARREEIDDILRLETM